MLLTKSEAANAKMPRSAQVPDSIRALVELSGLNVRPNPDFQGDVSRLSESLRNWIAEFRKLRANKHW